MLRDYVLVLVSLVGFQVVAQTEAPSKKIDYKERATKWLHSLLESRKEEPVRFETLVPEFSKERAPIPIEYQSSGFDTFKKTVSVDLTALGEGFMKKLYACHVSYLERLAELREKFPEKEIEGLGVTVDGNECVFNYVDGVRLRTSAYAEILRLSGEEFQNMGFGRMKLPHAKVDQGEGVLFGIPKTSLAVEIAKFADDKTLGLQEKADGILNYTYEKLPESFRWDLGDYVKGETPLTIGHITHEGPSRMDRVLDQQALVIPFAFIEGSVDTSTRKIKEETAVKGRGELAFYLVDGILNVATRRGKSTPWYKKVVYGSEFEEWERLSNTAEQP